MNNLISIAKIINFHGIKGEVKVGYTKGREEQLKSLKKLFIKQKGDFMELNIQTLKFHKNFAIVKFKEINSINDTELYKGLNLYIPKDIVVDFLEEDEYLVSDLDGLEAYDVNNNLLGTICAVGENNATNIISIKDNNDKIHLIPFVKELVPQIDLKNKRVTINKIEGLIN
jgi:16S rRNA processing protein RimM